MQRLPVVRRQSAQREARRRPIVSWAPGATQSQLVTHLGSWLWSTQITYETGGKTTASIHWSPPHNPSEVIILTYQLIGSPNQEEKLSHPPTPHLAMRLASEPSKRQGSTRPSQLTRELRYNNQLCSSGPPGTDRTPKGPQS